MLKRLLVITIGVAALVLNPFFGCGQDAPNFRYGPDEMRAAVEGTWKLTVPATTATPGYDLLLSISQAAQPVENHARAQGLVPEATACGTRTLVKSAAACGDMSTMPLDVVLTAGTGDATGRFSVYSLEFEHGVLELDVETSKVSARVTPTGTMSSVTVDEIPGASLVRVSTAQR
jgi:hypothetical protein